MSDLFHNSIKFKLLYLAYFRFCGSNTLHICAAFLYISIVLPFSTKLSNALQSKILSLSNICLPCVQNPLYSIYNPVSMFDGVIFNFFNNSFETFGMYMSHL